MLEQAPQWAQWLQAGELAAAVRSSPLLYPAANVLHVLGLVALVGPVLLLDLRLLGCARRLSAEALSRLATPLMLGGLATMLVTGALLFIADAAALAVQPLLWLKLGLLLLALLNAAVFRLLWQARLAEWDWAPPGAGRLQAGLSLLLWLAVPVAGRLLAYL